jgi:ABC-2 type transport system permease protein
MNRTFAFSSRNVKELIRDPLSYIFCLGFPLVMLILMTVMNDMIPDEANMTLFRIDQLAPGVAVFGLSFVMLFATLLVSKDRSGSFLIRLFASPMTALNFVAGYVLPLLLIAVAQLVICFVCGGVISLITQVTLSPWRMLLSALSLLPCALFFIAIGLLFGTLFSDKSAPPCSSIIISMCGILGGIWFSLDTIPEGHVFGTICRVLPFSHFVDAARQTLSGQFDGWGTHMAVGLAWAVGVGILSVILFHVRMRREP